jgi:LDH2 family malate/lactate/ureidoglycolate dehydrogenase
MDPTRAVLLPGEPEQLARVARTANGIPMAEATWQSLSNLADSLGVAVA